LVKQQLVSDVSDTISITQKYLSKSGGTRNLLKQSGGSFCKKFTNFDACLFVDAPVYDLTSAEVYPILIYSNFGKHSKLVQQQQQKQQQR